MSNKSFARVASIAVGFALHAGVLHAQAGTSSSSVDVGKKCNDAMSGTSPTFAACPSTTFKAGDGTALATSDNGSRTAFAGADLITGPDKKNGTVDALSQQFSQLFIIGTPQPGDQLLFHFRTQHDGFVDNGNPHDDTDDASWSLGLFGQGGETASVTKTFFSSNSNPTDIVFQSAVKTPHGFNLIIPLTATGIFDFFFAVEAQATISKGEPEGTELDAAIAAQLRRIRAIDANGNTIARATFDQTTGFATINLNTPEPSTIVLVATGLAAAAMTRRRRERSRVVG